jgi:hypothetical protein
MIKLSTGLRAAILGQFGVMAMMYQGVIDLYDDAPPATPDEPPNGRLLARVSKNGLAFQAGSGTNGLELVQRYDASLADNGTWYVGGLENGTLTWWRWKWKLADPDTQSRYYPRVDGLVGESLILPSREVSPTSILKIDEFNLTLGAC